MLNTALLVQLVLLFTTVSTQSIDEGWYSRTFSGTATYYGETSNSSCTLDDPLSAVYKGLVPVAISGPQYNSSTSCGLCIQVTGFGEGKGTTPINGTFTAFVSDRCDVCSSGDIDLAKDGDGRWSVEWVPVPCPVGQVSFVFEDSNSSYLKVQPRGLKSPATELSVNGQPGTRTADNFFEVVNGLGFSFPALVTVETVLGCKLSANVIDVINDVYPTELLNTDCVEGALVEVQPPATLHDPLLDPEHPHDGVLAKCSPLWGQCGGHNHKGPECCYEGLCTYSNEWYSQCRPVSSLPATANRSCPPLWGQCGGTDFNGPNCCQEGSCIYLNEWYWQCRS